MNDIIIKNEEDLEKHKDDYGYHIRGNAIFECSTDFTGRLIVDGFLSIKADWYIEAGGSIEAGGYIKAGGSIEAGGYIKAGGSIEAGGSIKADWYIEAGGSIEADWYIKAGWSIEAGSSIKAGDRHGISAGLSITCKGTLSFGINAYAGIKTWAVATDLEKTITCSKLLKGNIEYGILVETDEEERETIEIAGHKYLKEEVEKKLKDLEEIK